jgi:putative membrane protein
MQFVNSLSLLAADPNHNWGHGDWWPWGPLFFGFWILLIGAIALTVWYAARRGAQHAAAEPTGTDRAKAILAERFARGEISAEEYQDRLTHLL